MGGGIGAGLGYSSRQDDWDAYGDGKKMKMCDGLGWTGKKGGCGCYGVGVAWPWGGRDGYSNLRAGARWTTGIRASRSSSLALRCPALPAAVGDEGGRPPAVGANPIYILVSPSDCMLYDAV